METFLTVLLFIGFIALILKIFTSALGKIWKLLFNGLAGLLFLFLASYLGSGVGLELPINALTVIVSLITGVFGVAVMIILQLFI